MRHVPESRLIGFAVSTFTLGRPDAARPIVYIPRGTDDAFSSRGTRDGTDFLPEICERWNRRLSWCDRLIGQRRLDEGRKRRVRRVDWIAERLPVGREDQGRCPESGLIAWSWVRLRCHPSCPVRP